MIALIEVALIILAGPLLTVAAFSRPDRRALVGTRLACGESPLSIVWRLARTALGRAAIVVGLASLALLLTALMPRGPTVATVVTTQVALLAVAAGLLGLGLCCSSLWPDVHDAVGVAYVVIALVMGSLLLAGPYIARTPDATAVIQAVLVVNPVVAVASAFDFDVLRSETLYGLSPIGQRRFDYPAWYALAGVYLAAAVVLLAGAIERVAGLRRDIIG